MNHIGKMIIEDFLCTLDILTGITELEQGYVFASDIEEVFDEKQ